MPMTAQEIYALPVIRTTTELYLFEEHLPEAPASFEIPDDANTRVVFRYHFDRDFDGRRIMELVSCWFDDTPVMVTQSAGRDGRDHRARFITDPAAFIAMTTYLQSLRMIDDPADVIDVGAPMDELTTFYGYELEETLRAQASS